MKKSYKIISPLLFAMMFNVLQAQNFSVLDINQSKDAHPNNYSLFDYQYDFLNGPSQYAVLNGVAYFAANDGINGMELWRSDGTLAGTQMVKDINPGAASSNPYAITVSGNKIFFRADNGLNGFELWGSDGTAQNTKLIKDIFAGNTGSFPTFITDVNGTVYFFTSNINTADQLWKSDGTSNGTKLVADFYTYTYNYGSVGNQLTNVNGRLYFVLNAYSDPELWTSNGTANGTYKVKDINPYYGSNPCTLTAFNGLLYFSADDGTNGRRLWVSDGSDAGTYAVNNVNNIYLWNDAANNQLNKLAVFNNKLYFSGYSSDNDGTELCSYDPSNASNSPVVVKDFTPGNPSHNLYNFTDVNGTLFFTVYNGNGNDQALWKSDGTTAGTGMVKNINPGATNIYLYKAFVNADGNLLFSFADDAHGYEIWKSNGTANGTAMIKEINAGIYSAAVSNITYMGNGFSLFEATDGKTGLELWRTDGTAAGTVLLKNINKSATASSYPNWLTTGGNGSKLYFIASDNKYGNEMYVTDGKAANTKLVTDIMPGAFGSYPRNPVSLGGNTYFIAGILDTSFPNTSDDYLLSRLFKTDGTEAGTSLVSSPALETALNNTSYIMQSIATNNLVYLLVFNYINNHQELWRSDGTSAGTYSVKTDLDPYYSTNLTAVDDKLFFVNYDGIYGSEVWVTDGTAAGTHITKDITTGINYGGPAVLYAFNGKLYFRDTKNNFTYQLWSSDGTNAGTQVVKTVYTNEMLGVANGLLFFNANSDLEGAELWSTDGTPTGTKMVKDLWTGSASSYPHSGAATGTLVYFLANDGINGNELWRTDGTETGTGLVKDITPGISDSYIFPLVNVNGKLCFVHNDSLWSSNGTPRSTQPISDAGLAGISNIQNLTAAGSNIFFTAYNNTTGTELYSGKLSAEPAIAAADVQQAIAETISDIYPNPATNVLNIKISSAKSEVLQLIITNAAGKTMMNKMLPSNGAATAQLNISHLPAGTYFLQIISDDGKENTARKFIKQ